MLEENSYEPLAEVYLSVGDSYTNEDIYCLCSRVVIRARNEEEEEVAHELTDIREEQYFEGAVIQEVVQPQPQVQIKRKEHEEVLSCYCSASHCSTDEHDSVRENALHSDSGADLSESSRDLDWERYWATHGETIVWESWIKKYGAYIDPCYLAGVQAVEADPEETQFNVTGCENGKKSFSGFLDEEYHDVQEIDNSSETSEKSDHGDEYFRLRSCSRSSGKSSLLTDSLTNVTPMTIYSSELSCPEESSGQSNSNSFLSSSADSVSSNEQQWQHLWQEHFNEQYIASYNAFVAKINEIIPSDTYDNVFESSTKSMNGSIDCSKSTELISEKNNSDENKENIDITDVEFDCTSTSSDSKKAKRKFNIREAQSVGYLLGSLKTLSMEQEAKVKASSSSPDNDETTDISNNSEPPTEIPLKRGSKRVHEKDDPSLDRVKGAFTLMGFVFKPAEIRVEKSRIRKAHVVYRKRNIRSQNRSLNMKSVQPRHIRFDENGFVIDKSSSADQESQSYVVDKCRIELDDFSEKDDSSSDEDFVLADEWGSQKIKERQKKKKMSKKKTKIRNSLPKEMLENNKLMKYWYNRYRLFSLYDQGIKLDKESWYSVTPEKVSKHTAERCKCDLIIDACCGAGGNAIQFAFTCEKVIAIDIDPVKVELAKHNASIYGVMDRIEFIVGDFFALAPYLKADVIFLSPPWGGPGYLSSDSFCLDNITVEGGGKRLFETALAITPNIAYFLPKNINTDQLMQIAGPGGAVEIEQNFLEKRLIAITAYFGELVEAL
ncbi:trimethylguanosine synthase [Cimex lectularius]|uniref:Trimethylguanosine synthase n=1 Tax=Cimex lectularius TaxID=79782 RepID=A0A8I6RVA5_CIMLE|nr:trimethylguanosine synthase [Cimex lectularius]